MATQWWREPWRKLYTKLDAKWLGLTVSARGLADELIKYADADGRLFEVASPEEAGKEIALRLSAKPREYKRIAEDTRDLLKDTYLVIADGWLLIRNLREAQARLSPEARRQRAKRERDRLAKDDRDDDRDMSRDDDRDHGVTDARDSHRESNRSESSRDEKKQTHAHAHVDDPLPERVSKRTWWEAWKKAGLGEMQDAEGMNLVRYEFNREGCVADPFEYCAAWKKISTAWRKKFPTCGDGPLLMKDHLDKCTLVVNGEMDPSAVPKQVGASNYRLPQEMPPQPKRFTGNVYADEGGQ